MNKELFFYMFNTEEGNIYITKRTILNESLFTYKTNTGPYRKRSIGKVLKIDKGTRMDYLYISTVNLEDPWDIFNDRMIHKE